MSCHRRYCEVPYYKNSATTVTVTQPICSYSYTLPAGIYSDIDPDALDRKALSEARRRAYRYANQETTVECVTIPACTIYSANSQIEADSCALQYATSLIPNKIKTIEVTFYLGDGGVKLDDDYALRIGGVDIISNKRNIQHYYPYNNAFDPFLAELIAAGRFLKTTPANDLLGYGTYYEEILTSPDRFKVYWTTQESQCITGDIEICFWNGWGTLIAVPYDFSAVLRDGTVVTGSSATTVTIGSGDPSIPYPSGYVTPVIDETLCNPSAPPTWSAEATIDGFPELVHDVTTIDGDIWIFGTGLLVHYDPNTTVATNHFSTVDGITTGEALTQIRAVIKHNTSIFAFGSKSQVYRSDNNGATWNFVRAGSFTQTMSHRAASDGSTIAFTNGNASTGFIYSTDNGATWLTASRFGFGGAVFYTNGYWYRVYTPSSGVEIIERSATSILSPTWVDVTPYPTFFSNFSSSTFTVNLSIQSARLLVRDYNTKKVWSSSNNGDTWVEETTLAPTIEITECIYADTDVMLFTSQLTGDSFISSDGAMWDEQPIDATPDRWGFLRIGNTLYSFYDNTTTIAFRTLDLSYYIS